MNPPWAHEIPSAVACLKSGGTLLYPTDTIWGLGCDPRNTAAVEKLFILKGRPKEKSLILLASSVAQVQSIVGNIPAAAIHLLHTPSDRPLTIVYPESKKIGEGIAAPDGSIAIRITQDPFCQALITAFDHPITSTSANLSGHPFNGTFQDIPSQIRTGADHIIHHRQDENTQSPPSKIIKLLPDGTLQVIRP
jgi:L-threonylcarbamoyladenylate synthase